MVAIGRRVYGLGAVALGIGGLAFGALAAMGQQVPAHVAGPLAAYACAGLLIAAGIAINLPRVAAAAALVLTAWFALWTLGLHLPNALKQPLVWVSWESLAEDTAMVLGGLLAYALILGDSPRAAALRRYVRPVFGLCLVVFGTSEFVYSKFTASLVPTWLPPSQLAWTYLTGVCQIAAGLAVLSRIQARLAATLLTAMYVVFGLIVHIPRLIADPTALGAWSEHGVNLVLCGAAWCLADSLAEPKPAPA
jgi:uncharacterized membrane protein